MQIAQVEREDWKKAVLAYLVAYTKTPIQAQVCDHQSCYSEEN